MRELSIGSSRYRIVTASRGSEWVAIAQRPDGTGPFGVECVGATETEAANRMVAWLEWQAEHTSALESLQHAEHAYHRVIAGSAFASPTDGPTPIELQKESLDQLEAARERLDEIRARKPPCSA